MNSNPNLELEKEFNPIPAIRVLQILEGKRKLPPLDLQRFAAEDEGRTEEPTERRLREERDKGNVPKSQDLVQAATLLGTTLMLFMTGTWVFHQITDVFERYLGQDFSRLGNPGEEEVRLLLLGFFWETAKIVAPIMIAAMVMGIVGSLAQVGLLFTLRPLEFKPDRLMPDFKRVLPVRRTLINLLKTSAQMGIIATAAYVIIADDFVSMLSAGGMDLPQAISLFATVALKLLIVAAVILGILAVPDYFYQRFEYMENLKMNISEVKRERKEEEGDPLLRQRQRERGFELRSQRNMLGEVPSADVVVTNPTHFAVALKYDPERAGAPIVIAKGADHLAFLIRNIARENRVPVEENPPLARALYADVDLGQEIPETLYRVVSLLFAKLDRFKTAGAGR